MLGLMKERYHADHEAYCAEDKGPQSYPRRHSQRRVGCATRPENLFNGRSGRDLKVVGLVEFDPEAITHLKVQPKPLQAFDDETDKTKGALTELSRTYTLKLLAGGEEAQELFASLAKLASIVR